jgi:hypothetical protein
MICLNLIVAYLQEASKLYCLCQLPYNEEKPMLGCDYCQVRNTPFTRMYSNTNQEAGISLVSARRLNSRDSAFHLCFSCLEAVLEGNLS